MCRHIDIRAGVRLRREAPDRAGLLAQVHLGAHVFFMT